MSLMFVQPGRAAVLCGITFGLGFALNANVMAAPVDNFTISGQVNHSVTLNTDDPQPLLGLPNITESGLPVAGNYTGVSLYGLLSSSAVGIVPDPTQTKNSFTSQYVLATGSDGYHVVFSGGELDPGFGGSNTTRPDLVAYQLNSGAIGANGAFRTIAPNDVKGGRAVSNLVSLQVLNTPTKTGIGGYSSQFTVSGLINTPLTILASGVDAGGDFGGLTALTENVTYTSAGSLVNKTFTGISLWSFLDTITGLSTDPAQAKNHLDEYVLATGSDGYKAVFSLGELDPSFGGAAADSLSQDLITYNANGNGFQLVVPGDVKGGRYVSNLVSLEVISASASTIPEPASAALFAAGLGLIGFMRRPRARFV